MGKSSQYSMRRLKILAMFRTAFDPARITFSSKRRARRPTRDPSRIPSVLRFFATQFGSPEALHTRHCLGFGTWSRQSMALSWCTNGLGGGMACSGDREGLHVETDCCTSCGIPWTYAPEIFREGDRSCVVIRQPRTATEARRVLRVFRSQELDCVRYGGANPRIISILDRAGATSGSSPQPQSPRVRRVPPPPALRAVLALFFWISAVMAIGGISSAFLGNWVPALTTLAGGTGLALTLAAWRRRAWGLWGLLSLAGLVDVVVMGAAIAGHRSGMAVPMLFAAAALALFSLRRWYLPIASSR